MRHVRQDVLALPRGACFRFLLRLAQYRDKTAPFGRGSVSSIVPCTEPRAQQAVFSAFRETVTVICEPQEASQDGLGRDVALHPARRVGHSYKARMPFLSMAVWGGSFRVRQPATV